MGEDERSTLVLRPFSPTDWCGSFFRRDRQWLICSMLATRCSMRLPKAA